MSFASKLRAAGAASALSLLALAALPAQAVSVGAAAPAFTLDQLGGGKLSLADLKGHVVYLDFWASWCGPCKQSFPFMNELQARYAARGLKIVAVNVDERPADANKFLAEVPPKFTVVLDPKGLTPGAYDVQGMPTSMLIDGSGKVLMVHTSFSEAEKPALTQQIEKALAGGKP